MSSLVRRPEMEAGLLRGRRIFLRDGLPYLEYPSGKAFLCHQDEVLDLIGEGNVDLKRNVDEGVIDITIKKGL